MGESQAPRVLEDVLVIDLSEQVAGPYCTRLLAGLGAEVIKVERPGVGDVARRAEPLTPVESLECGALFQHLNASKKSLTLDLESPKGRDYLGRLTQQAQIVVESFAPGYLDVLGIGYSSLAQGNPGLVMTSISSFGQDGPYRDYAATDLTCVAAGGMLYLCGDPQREPLKIGGLQAEYLGGLNGAIATLAALWDAETSGKGQWIDVSIMESVVSALEGTTVAYSSGGEIRRRQGNRHGQACPTTILPCKDGYVGITFASDEDWNLFASMSNQKELLAPRHARGEDRLRFANEIEEILRMHFMERTREEVFHWAQELRLPFSMVLTPEELLNDPQHRARDFFTAVDHPVLGEVLQVGAPFVMGETPWRVGRAPLLGEHTEEVLRERLSLDEGEMWALRREGII